MNKVLAIVALAEAGTGVVLLAYPPVVVRLLFGLEIEGAGIIMSRIAGICLIGLGVACWPDNATLRALCGILTYSVLAMLYLSYVGIRGGWVGLLLWPAVAVHAIIIILLVRARSKERKAMV